MAHSIRQKDAGQIPAKRAQIVKISANVSHGPVAGEDLKRALVHARRGKHARLKSRRHFQFLHHLSIQERLLAQAGLQRLNGFIQLAVFEEQLFLQFLHALGRVHPGHELSQLKRLGQIIIGSRLQAALYFSQFGPSRQHDHISMRHVLHCAQAAQDTVTVQDGHVDVKNHDIGTDLLHETEPFQPVRRR